MVKMRSGANRLHREQPQPNYDKRLREAIRFFKAEARGAT